MWQEAGRASGIGLATFHAGFHQLLEGFAGLDGFGLCYVAQEDHAGAGSLDGFHGFVHLPRGLEAEWVKQLVAEQLVSVKTRRGFQRLEWQKLRERNEVLDCRVYARAAAWIAGADRWTDEKWRDLEDQVGPMPKQMLDVKPDASIAAGVLARAPVAGGKRRSDWLSGVDKGWLR